MPSTRSPDSDTLRQFLASQAGKPFSYGDVGATQSNFPKDFNRDMRRWMVGEGEGDFAAGVEAMKAWEMFPKPWTRVFPSEVPQAEGRTFVIVIRVLGLYWINASRVIYMVNDTGGTKRVGFAYGTLGAHAEKGEERFLLEMSPDGTVWYDLSAFSKPNHWLARLGAPLVRMLQRRFAHESCKALIDAIAARRPS
jgi:uncharacterized protein (UPF0548 family)